MICSVHCRSGSSHMVPQCWGYGCM